MVKSFVSNLPDDFHCLQASYAMVVESLTGYLPNVEEAERDTGFVSGRPTWPFRMFLSLAEKHLAVVDFELFDVGLFARDPGAAIFEQTQDAETTETMLSTMNVELEASRARLCLESPLVTFLYAQPDLSDVNRACLGGGAIISNVNAQPLRGRDGYVGHMVVIDRYEDGYVILQDPGLPPMRDWRVGLDQFRHAWMYPTEKMANLWVVFPSVAAAADFIA